MPNVLVLYYSSYGHIEAMAYAQAEGARRVPKAQVTVKRVPELMPAASPGGNAIMIVKTTTRNGRPVMASIGPVGGGGGGTPFRHGSDGAGGAKGFLHNKPIEITEADVPIRFLRYGLEPDTGAPEPYRGGLSAVMEFEFSSPETIITARSRNRSVMPS